MKASGRATCHVGSVVSERVKTTPPIRSAEAASVSARWATLQGFIFSGALAGLAGGLHVLLLHGAREGSYQVVQSVEVFSGATIGGLGSLGGAIVGWAARMARGCTSGQALSGGAVLSVGSWVFMFSVFAGGYALSVLVRRLWN